MAHDILNSELFQTQGSDTKTTSKKSINNEVKKEGSSLFDSLLKDAKIKADSSISGISKNKANNVQKEVVESIPLQTNQKNEKFDKTTEQKISLTSNGTSVTTVKTNEGLKNVVPPSQASVSKTVEIISNGKGTENTIHRTNESLKNINSPATMQENSIKVLDSIKVKLKDDNTNIVELPKTTSKSSLLTEKIDIPKVEIVSSKIQKAVQKQMIEGKEEQKAPLSLLDKMMQDLKKDTQIENKNLTKAVLDSEGEINLNKVPKENSTKENKVVKKEIVSEDKVVKIVDEKINSASNIVAKNTKEELSKETIKANILSPIQEKKDFKLEKENQSSKIETPVQKVSQQRSLLDKMVEEITEKSIDKGEEKKEIKKTNPKTIVKSDENVGKLFVELSDGIQPENTQKESTLEINDTKETKILSSLADSLSGKTKIQKRVDETAKLENLQDGKGQFGANLFLSNQKVQAEILSKQKLTEAKELLIDGEKTTKTVKKTADILELKATKIEVVGEVDNSNLVVKNANTKQNDLGIHNQQTFLNRMFLNKENSEQIINAKVMEEKIVEVKTVNEETKKINSDVSITVEKSLVEAFTTKVIASKQAMGSFMSDVARNMYLNYKPPVTAFKINLDPINLGNIAIVMRNNKSENTLNISLNMSQNTTYDTFSDNKSALQNALGRIFNQNEGSFSLDFGMQNDSSNQEFEQQRQNQENRQIIENRIQGEKILEDDGQAIEVETKKSYM